MITIVIPFHSNVSYTHKVSFTVGELINDLAILIKDMDMAVLYEHAELTLFLPLSVNGDKISGMTLFYKFICLCDYLSRPVLKNRKYSLFFYYFSGDKIVYGFIFLN